MMHPAVYLVTVFAAAIDTGQSRRRNFSLLHDRREFRKIFGRRFAEIVAPDTSISLKKLPHMPQPPP
jgi:hypothetical protein